MNFSKGKQKISINKIDDKSGRQVTFSKRHKGLFKKAAELNLLTGAHVAVVTFTEGGKPYSIGEPSVGAVLQRYFEGNNGIYINNNDDDNLKVNVGGKGRNMPPRGGFLWDTPVEGLGLSELEDMKAALEELKSKVALRFCDNIMMSNNVSGSASNNYQMVVGDNNNNISNTNNSYPGTLEDIFDDDYNIISPSNSYPVDHNHQAGVIDDHAYFTEWKWKQVEAY